eukprot:CAMPEP_0202690856 /NCGR_PEP_ID=MMETSP1385-20130828/5739_1 /ASSEMBLY_ACC=CAM_ASM_000861 /TAXON_ID=933848 /ORGANISM="Elphidium margaritaceum" /LENGTH=258 /DNA_ID=CAMNT_0049346171 /DNA_START=42 /DNA_END=818 /DNA_ORIENTATION=+
MGTRNSRPIIPPPDVLTKINTKSKEFESIKLEFKELCTTSKNSIPKETFLKYLSRRFPSFSDRLLERFFIVLAYNNKNEIVFEEFVQAKYLLDHIPPEPTIQIAKSADDFFTEEDVIYDYRLKFIFTLFDLDFNNVISTKEFEEFLPCLMQDEKYGHIEAEELKDYALWFQQIREFAFIQFDRQRMDRLSWRDFRALARCDLTVQNLMKQITPQKAEYECFTYAQAIQRKNEKKKFKKEQKMKQNLQQKTDVKSPSAQ